MPDPLVAARKRQLARLGGAKPPVPRAAMALAKSQAYQDAADAPSTLRAYTADLANYEAWCKRHGFEPMPATPEIVGAYLAAAGEGYALPTLRRRVAALLCHYFNSLKYRRFLGKNRQNVASYWARPGEDQASVCAS